MTRQKATTIGFTAILMWALLALMTIGSAPVPPFLLNALCFGIGGAIGLVWVAFGAGFGVLRQVSWKVYAFGTLGLFGYHALYFTAFRIAPFRLMQVCRARGMRTILGGDTASGGAAVASTAADAAMVEARLARPDVEPQPAQ